MCGRYALLEPSKAFLDFLGVQDGLFQSYNIAPTQLAPIVLQQDNNRGVLKARWGLIPSWVKEPKNFKANLFNARAETLKEKPSFKNSFKQKRCLVPANGFYEWKKSAKQKQPYYIYQDQGLAFAGLYDRWQNNGIEIISFTIITTAPNSFMQTIHNRMPAILQPKDYQLWLSPQTKLDRLESLLQPSTANLKAHPVSKQVGQVSNNGPDLIKTLNNTNIS